MGSEAERLYSKLLDLRREKEKLLDIKRKADVKKSFQRRKKRKAEEISLSPESKKREFVNQLLALPKA